ncbi:MAG TPA: TonB-dependent receptor, partial [Candidatus Acidoferrales bacterium]|nr:TonB-dependent receptor [Candidatus Acidoferrales bacterium]
MRRRVVLFLACWILAILPAAASEITGTIVGTVTDAQKKSVPKATITLTNAEMNVVIRTLQTNDEGQYTAPLLPIGHYSVTAEAAGFRKATRTGVELNVNDHLTVNFTLELGPITDTVTVEAEALQVDLQTPTAAGLITGTQIRELSLNNRNYIQLVALMPGVATGFSSDQPEIGVTSFTGLSNQVNLAINGNRPTQNNWTIDGADNVDRGANLTLLTFPSVDAIAEFKVLRGQYNPEFGRSSSGEINVVTRGGGNTFHGGIYEFFRNDVLNANNFFNNRNSIARPALRYNDFGGTFSGPIYKKKTFFFFSEEARRVKTFTTLTGTVPSQAERAGTFSTPVCLNRACTATGTQVTTIDPAAAAYIKDIFSKLPQPQDLTRDQLTSLGQNTFNHRQEVIRIDHVFGPRFSVFGRLVNDSIPTVEPGGLFTGSSLPGVATTSTNAPGRSVTTRLTMTLSPTLLNEVGYAYSYGAVISDPTGLGASGNSPDVGKAVTLPLPSTIVRVPDLNFADNSGVFGFGSYRDYNRNHNVFDNFTRILGRHTMKVGFTYHRYQKSENAGGGNNGSFSFDDTPPTGSGTKAFRQEWANFLQGLVSSFTQTAVDFHAEVRQRQFEMYVQDEFRVRSNLTLTYGVRYSYFGPATDALGHATTFDPSRFDPAKAPQIDQATGLLIPGTGVPLNGVVIGGVNSKLDDAVNNHDSLDFAPRVGIAWDPFKTGKTSVRAGYGIFFDAPAVNSLEQFQFSNPPFVQNITISNTTLSKPGNVAPDLNVVPPFLGGPATDWRQPYSEQWSLDIQREFWRGIVLDVGYYGNVGRHLIGVVDINEPLPGTFLTAGFSPPITSPVGFGTPTQRLNFIRPFLGYDAINIFKTIFTSNYHSLQVSAQKRFRGQSLLAVNYTYSHGLTTSQSDFRSPQNIYDIRSEYGA